MIEKIIGIIIKDNCDLTDSALREKYTVTAGIFGIICNLFLFLLKFSIGSIMKSMGIISDAFNNLSDIGSSVVSVLGAKLSNKKPDREHPFGHGRFEYISSLIVSFIIMIVGFELLKTSVNKLLNPEVIQFNTVMICILTASVLVKIFMYSYNKYIGCKIKSGVLEAAAKDSLNDVFASISVILTAVVSRFVSIPRLDSFTGIILSLIILKSGFDIAKDTVDILLGTSPEKETVDKINEMILNGESIIGVHDLIIHDYGPGRVMASVHAEVPSNADIVRIHEEIDSLEKYIENELGIHTVIHMDPISVNDEKTKEIKKSVIGIVKSIDERLNIHDFRMTDGEENINLIFDLEIPPEYEIPKIAGQVESLLKKENPKYNSVIQFDVVYT